MKREASEEEMLVKMAGLCARAEQCSADIREKVMKKGFSSDMAGKIVDYLKKNNYLDDARYARAYAADKVRFAGWGRLKVRMHLKAKHIDDATIKQGLAYIDEAEYVEVIRRALMAKARNLDVNDAGHRQKLYRHLASRGFESGLIIKAIREYIKGHAEVDN